MRRFLESQYIIEEEEEEENQDGVVLGNAEGEIIDEDNIDEEIEGRSDYRRSPYISPVLIEEEEEESSIDEDMALIIRKGVYPYEYMTDMNKFNENKLPPKKDFKSTLKIEEISDEEYEHAQNVFNHFEMKDLLDYTNLYVTTDVLILADIFEQFRDSCIRHYELDPAHFYTAPGLSFQAALKMTKVEMELLTDVNMHLFIEAGIRGGVVMISKRYAKAHTAESSQYDHHPSWHPSRSLIYLDAKNLYGWAMSQCLLIGKFEWVHEDELSNFTSEYIQQLEKNSDTGYIFEVDLV